MNTLRAGAMVSLAPVNSGLSEAEAGARVEEYVRSVAG